MISVQMYSPEGVLNGTFEHLPDTYQEELSPNDVFLILEYQNRYYEKTAGADYEGMSHNKIVRFIRTSAMLEGLDYSTEEIRTVLEAEADYLTEFGFE